MAHSIPLKKIIIGTRGSALALIQTDIVSKALISVDPSLTIEVRVIRTHGDTNQKSIPLDTIGKGWFTKEIENELLDGMVDLAVHSLKDMAEEMPNGLMIGAYLPREDARDVLITKHGESLEKLKRDAVVGTDSSRRQIQMHALRPDMQMKSLRGNVQKRLEKLLSEPYDAIILAAAGLKRLGLVDRIAHYFDFNEMVPSPGQGILAVQTRESDVALQSILTSINDPDAAHAARIERSFSRVMGGGCKSPTGAYAFRDGSYCRLTGMTEGPDGRIIREEMHAKWDVSADLGEKLAEKMLRDRKRHA